MSTSAPGMIKNHAAFIWSVADLLRGDYKQSEYGKVVLPLTVIRRLDCVLEPTKNKVLAVHRQYGNRDAILRAAAGDLAFYNTSPLTLQCWRTQRRSPTNCAPTSPGSPRPRGT
jgi:type I restriction enzyme M protein